ncbi:MAG: GGDEF domain-containing protein [Candidatus Adiutrix sp.]|jgi:diguanylate cyclase|nr:GGDEF domain-containing protein [Candidatus Adiutrix sp.]
MDGKPYINIADTDKESEAVQAEVDNSYSVAKRLLPFLAKRGIPASPKNYRIFYDYLLYSNPVLNKAVNELLGNNAKFYSRLSSSLYDHFYSREVAESQAQAIKQATTDFMAASSALEQNLETAISQTSRYQKALNDSSRQMAQVTRADELQSLLDELLSETEAALQHHDIFSNHMSEAGQLIARLKTELENQTTLALVDELTKLNNRRHLNLEAPKLMSQAAQSGRPISAIVFDLDFFKRINDTWGHNFGDKVLVVCSNLIKQAARVKDLAVRLGGEEFLLFCPDLSLDEAGKVAEKVRASIEGTDITIRGQSLLVTISGGVAQYVPGEELSDLLGRADKALYRAKNEGRNQVRLAESAYDFAKVRPGPAEPGR